jgi:hypothetical protein
MLLGMSLSTFTLLHVIISLAGIGSGFIVLFGLLNSKRLDGWTAIFLTTTVLTSVTGFMFPFEKLLPAHILGALSLIVLAVAIWARYAAHLAGAWRGTYVDRRHRTVPQLLRGGGAGVYENPGLRWLRRSKNCRSPSRNYWSWQLRLADLACGETVSPASVRAT